MLIYKFTSVHRFGPNKFDNVFGKNQFPQDIREQKSFAINFPLLHVCGSSLGQKLVSSCSRLKLFGSPLALIAPYLN